MTTKVSFCHLGQKTGLITGWGGAVGFVRRSGEIVRRLSDEVNAHSEGESGGSAEEAEVDALDERAVDTHSFETYRPSSHLTAFASSVCGHKPCRRQTRSSIKASERADRLCPAAGYPCP
jgi:hypothetical protein